MASVSLPQDRAVAGERPRAPVLLRWRVFLTRAGLDARLARGEDPSSCRELALRADQLERPTVRRRFARALRDVVDAADEPGRALTAATPLDWMAVREARGRILDLATELEEREHVRARGVAMAAGLLRDGAGPLYLPAVPDTLRTATRRAIEELS